MSKYDQVYEEKERFVALLSAVFVEFKKVESLRYKKEGHEEMVYVRHANGYVEKIDVTGNSLIAISMEINRLLYGERPVGYAGSYHEK